ncbi:MAG TPA: hypothetical protein VJU82_15485 [Acidobacteriaceae bacterium]|nr:hypothetical protein [Acidobacteriaceae bacterium]
MVAYAALRCANMPNQCNLYEMASKYGWDETDVLAFLRCQKAPSKKMLRDISKELEVSSEQLHRILDQ